MRFCCLFAAQLWDVHAGTGHDGVPLRRVQERSADLPQGHTGQRGMNGQQQTSRRRAVSAAAALAMQAAMQRAHMSSVMCDVPWCWQWYLCPVWRRACSGPMCPCATSLLHALPCAHPLVTILTSPRPAWIQPGTLACHALALPLTGCVAQRSVQGGEPCAQGVHRAVHTTRPRAATRGTAAAQKPIL